MADQSLPDEGVIQIEVPVTAFYDLAEVDPSDVKEGQRAVTLANGRAGVQYLREEASTTSIGIGSWQIAELRAATKNPDSEFYGMTDHEIAGVLVRREMARHAPREHWGQPSSNHPGLQKHLRRVIAPTGGDSHDA